MTGLKYKLAHKRSNSENSSATDNAQKQFLIDILEEMIGQLKSGAVPIEEPLPLLVTNKKKAH